MWCRQRRNLALTLYDNDEVINSMRSLVGAAMHLVAAFAYLAVFGVNLNHVVLTLSSTGISLAVIFGNSMRAVYESMVFLFVVRPFQIGDCILYAGERHWVRSFSLLTTLLSRFDGCQVWVCSRVVLCALQPERVQLLPAQGRWSGSDCHCPRRTRTQSWHTL